MEKKHLEKLKELGNRLDSIVSCTPVMVGGGQINWKESLDAAKLIQLQREFKQLVQEIENEQKN